LFDYIIVLKVEICTIWQYWQARNQDNVSEWGDMSIRGLLFQ